MGRKQLRRISHILGADATSSRSEAEIDYMARALLMPFEAVKQMLEDDGYIIQEPTGEIHFRSPIIQEFWINRYLK